MLNMTDTKGRDGHGGTPQLTPRRGQCPGTEGKRRSRPSTPLGRRRLPTISGPCAQSNDELEDHRWIPQTVSEELTHLAHPVANGLWMDHECRGDVFAAALVQEPGPQSLFETVAAIRAKVGERGEDARP